MLTRILVFSRVVISSGSSRATPSKNPKNQTLTSIDGGHSHLNGEDKSFLALPSSRRGEVGSQLGNLTLFFSSYYVYFSINLGGQVKCWRLKLRVSYLQIADKNYGINYNSLFGSCELFKKSCMLVFFYIFITNSRILENIKSAFNSDLSPNSK